MTIAVACMPSLAKLWKVKLSDTGFFRSIQSLLSLVRGHDTRKTSSEKGIPLQNDSTTGLQGRDGSYEIRYSRNNSGEMEPQFSLGHDA